VLPSISALTPSGAAAGSGALTLTVSGSNFDQSSQVRWNGGALATTYIGSSQLTALATAQQVASAGSVSVSVVNSGAGGGTSNSVTFIVSASAPVPAIASLAPATVPAGAAGFTLVVTGSGFLGASAINWNGVPRPTTYLGPSQLSTYVAASDVAAAGTVDITIDNPAPGGGSSAPAVFTISPPTTSSAYIRQVAAYNAYPGDNSSAWRVVLTDVLAGSTIYVVGTWPNFSSNYPSMQVADGTNVYTLLGRYDDRSQFDLGIQGTQSIGHWYTSNVPAGAYTINMAPAAGTFEDFVGLVAFEVAGVTSSPLDGQVLQVQMHVAPGNDALSVALTTSNPQGILIAVAVDDVDGAAPAAPLAGSDSFDAGELWDFLGVGNPSSRAEYALFGSAGTHAVHFSPREAGAQLPNYMMVAAFFDASGAGTVARTVPTRTRAVPSH